MMLDRATCNVAATVFTGNLPDLASATARSVFLPVQVQGTVGNLVCGAIVKPQEAGYGDQEGHVGRAFVGARSEGGVFQGWAFRRAEESAGRARLERGTGRPSRWPGGGGQGQSPQWLFEEDGADPECQAGLAYSARSGRHVRPEADRPVS